MSEARWCVEEMPAGFPVAMGWCPTAEAATSEVMRYAQQYAEDGPIRYWVRMKRKTIVQGTMNHQPESKHEPAR